MIRRREFLGGVSLAASVGLAGCISFEYAPYDIDVIDRDSGIAPDVLGRVVSSGDSYAVGAGMLSGSSFKGYDLLVIPEGVEVGSVVEGSVKEYSEFVSRAELLYVVDTSEVSLEEWEEVLALEHMDWWIPTRFRVIGEDEIGESYVFELYSVRFEPEFEVVNSWTVRFTRE